MMASDKANYVVNYFTFDISSIVNQTQCANQNLPICQYQVLTDAQNGIEIVSNEIIENSAIDKEDNGRINIIEGVMIASSPQEPFSTNECELELSDNGDVTDENDNNNNDEDEMIEEEEDDDLADLTNLNWLTELKNITNLPPATQEVTEKRSDPPSQRFDKFINQVNKMRENYEKRRDLYETVASEKPPFNYAQIIGMALIEEGRLTLKQICDWIERKFAYYKTHKNWNNSIRHNLSLNFFFTKVARDKNEKGKGGYWELAVDMHKTARKRIRHRRKKGDAAYSRAIIRHGRLLRSKVSCKKDESSAKSVGGSSNVSDFVSSPSNINDDDSSASLEEQNVTEIEIIEEQQNINNIIDDNQNAIIIPNPTLYESPNVIVEAIPTYQFNQFNHIENFDDNELNQLICMNDQELIDDFLSYNSGNEEFL